MISEFGHALLEAGAPVPLDKSANRKAEAGSEQHSGNSWPALFEGRFKFRQRIPVMVARSVAPQVQCKGT